MYAIAPLSLVKGENNWREYESALRATQDRAYNRAQEIWDGYTPGGIFPTGKQFGIRPLVANEMANDVSATTLSGTYTFRKNHTGTGWRNLFNYTTRKDIMHGFVGFAVSETILNVNQIRAEIGDKKLPILGLDEAQLYNSYGFLIKADEGKELVAEPETAVLVKGYFTATGYQTFMPLGFELYKRIDLVITET